MIVPQITLLSVSGHSREVLKLSIFGIKLGKGALFDALSIGFRGKPKKSILHRRIKIERIFPCGHWEKIKIIIFCYTLSWHFPYTYGL